MFITIMEYCVDLHNRDHVLMKPVLIINLEVKDNHEEAAIGARLTLVLCQEVGVCVICCEQIYSLTEFDRYFCVPFLLADRSN